MFNTHTFHGVDGILTIADSPDSPLDNGSPIETYFAEQNGVVGRVTNVAVAVHMEVKPFHEIGARIPKELRAGNISVTGTVQRAFVNGAMLRMLLGNYADNTEANAFAMPLFNMILSMNNLRGEEGQGSSKLTVFNVLFDSWQFNVPEDDFVLERLSFQARRVTVQDMELAT